MVDPLENIRFVLVRPARPGNIGAAARAMKNMGLTQLCLVEPGDFLNPESYTLAYGAHDLLEGAKVFSSLASALARTGFVVGTTARSHKGYGKPLPLQTVMPVLLEKARHGPVAVLFGPESSGLANEEIALCQTLAGIPTGASHSSLNLAQAVMVAAYELRRNLAEPAAARLPLRTPASTDQRERMFAEWKEILSGIGFIQGRQGAHLMADLRRILGRADPDAREVRILRGILRQVRWALTHPSKNCFSKTEPLK